ncbi:hypothetical protein ONZ51_g5245 [Trametes cubensis]|uniref:F-box domain-containing protein n=1 Tax=Trametes cubensis TaxID=1111947 RepID=A0AAD7TUD7_9APHY|nr:hypothetical protein ONZ51_g5245 [Trametes cubensis]
MSTVEQRGEDHTSSNIDALPVELIDLVFQYASEHIDTTSACSLVSRTWREIALPHLFSWLTVERRDAFEDFRDFLERHPHITRCIRTLELAQISDSTSRGSLSAVGLDSLTELVAKLPALQVLFLRGVFFVDPQHPDASILTSPGTSHRQLKHLEIRDCFGHVKSDLPLIDLPTLIGILQTLPADSVTLSYENIVAIPPSDPRMTRMLRPSTRLHLREITLDSVEFDDQRHDDMRHLYDALRQVLAPGYLHSFLSRVGFGTYPDPESMRAFGELVHSTAETLQHLGLPFTVRHLVKASEHLPEHWRILNLHECHNLQSFTLSVHPPMLRTLAAARGTPYRQDVPLSTTCISILSHLPPTVRTFTLAICDEVAPAHIKNKKMGLEALDEALLSAERFPSLQLVEVTLRQRYHPEASIHGCELAVREVMPKCDRKGILKVSKDVTVMKSD